MIRALTENVKLLICNGCVPGTARILKGESNDFVVKSQGKSQTQPDGGETEQSEGANERERERSDR